MKEKVVNKVKIEIELSYEGDVVPDEVWQTFFASAIAEAAEGAAQTDQPMFINDLSIVVS
jgi:hypothetical protein